MRLNLLLSDFKSVTSVCFQGNGSTWNTSCTCICQDRFPGWVVPVRDRNKISGVAGGARRVQGPFFIAPASSIDKLVQRALSSGPYLPESPFVRT